MGESYQDPAIRAENAADAERETARVTDLVMAALNGEE